MPPEPSLDATGIARRQFSTARKGYDQAEVRAYLEELSALVGRLQRGEADQHRRAEDAEARAQLAEQLDEHRLVELLGEETARVLDAAREAASGIRAKAEESAARMIREAQAQAQALVGQAERDAHAGRAEVMAEAEASRREAEAEVERRRAEGDVLVEEMRRAAKAEVEEMLAEGRRMRDEAAAAAAQVRVAARDEGRRLVGEAHAARERILVDLARRRRTAREQLERLNGARERLLAAYEVVRRTVDEATTELSVALPQAREASAAAVRRVRDEPDASVDVLEAELSVARMSGEAGAPVVSERELDAVLEELAREEAARAATRRHPVAADAAPGVGVGSGDAPGPTGGEGAGPAVGPGEVAPAGVGPGEATAPAVGRRDRSAGPRGTGAPEPGAASGTLTTATAGATRATSAAVTTGPTGAAGSTGGHLATAPAAATPPPVIPRLPAAAAGRPQTDAERWGVRLPRSSRKGSRERPPVAVAGPDPAPAPAATRPPASGPAPASPEDETGPYVDELFARIRAEREDGVTPPDQAEPHEGLAAPDQPPATGDVPPGASAAGPAPGTSAPVASAAGSLPGTSAPVARAGGSLPGVDDPGEGGPAPEVGRGGREPVAGGEGGAPGGEVGGDAPPGPGGDAEPASGATVEDHVGTGAGERPASGRGVQGDGPAAGDDPVGEEGGPGSGDRPAGAGPDPETGHRRARSAVPPTGDGSAPGGGDQAGEGDARATHAAGGGDPAGGGDAGATHAAGGDEAGAVDPATWALRSRDEVLVPLERDLARRLKRILADEQNEVLDRLRRGGDVQLSDVLPDADEHAARYAGAAGPVLGVAASHGRSTVGGEREVPCDVLAEELGRSLTGPLRGRVQRSLDEADGDLDEVTERLRALYREWKGQRIAGAVRHYSAAAYSAGVAGALAPGTAQRWLVDPSCASCPDCDDNALAGEVPGGQAFPTGDVAPPAHPDCRCLVVPATALAVA